MFKTNNSNTRKRVYDYLIMAAFDYAGKCLEVENPSEAAIKRFVVDDVKRAKSYEFSRGKNIIEIIKDYLLGLPLATAFCYQAEWNLLNEWTGENNDYMAASEDDIMKADEKYWHLLAHEIYRWGGSWK